MKEVLQLGGSCLLYSVLRIPPPIPLALDLRKVSFMGDRALLSVPEVLHCMHFRKNRLCLSSVLS